jgi:hypothetical protein
VGNVTGAIEVSIDKAKCMVGYRDQNERPGRYIEIGNGSFECVEQFKCLGTF